MKFVGAIIGSLRALQVYLLPKLLSTVIGASLPMLLSWIQIQVKIHPYYPISSSFISLHPELYFELCTIEVDLSHLSGTSNVQSIQKHSGVYFKVVYELVMLFGGTEIEVQLCWKENVRFQQTICF